MGSVNCENIYIGIKKIVSKNTLLYNVLYQSMYNNLQMQSLLKINW